MRALWYVTALWLAPLLVAAQTLPDPDGVAPATPPEVIATLHDNAASSPSAQEDSNTTPAFTLTISAPDDIKTLLERHLELQRYRSLSDLSNDELDRLLDMAKLDANQLLATQGYFSPLITLSRSAEAQASAPREVQMVVVPGEPVQVRQVRLQFSGPISADPEDAAQRALITESWLLPAGNRFTQAAWSAAKQQALSQLTGQRYPTGTVSVSEADVDPDTHSATLTLTLDSGPAFRLGALVPTGLNRYDTELVRRLARLPEGSDYDLKELVAAQQRLTRSGYFNTAFIRLDTSGANPQTAPVLVTLREAPLQKVTIGVGASSDSGARFSAEHLHQMVPGLGWRALSKLSLDQDTQSLSTELTAPPNEAGWRWNTSLLLQNELSGSTEVNSQRWRGGSSKEQERIDRSYYLEYNRADSISTDDTPSSQAESISANYAFTLREFDTLPFPTSGWALGMEVGGGTTLGSEHIPFGRMLARWQAFLPLGHQADSSLTDLRAGRLALRAQLGAVVVKDGTSLPSTLLFLAGGASSVRGYALRSIGITEADGTVNAGRYLATGTVEWQRPITSQGRLTDWEGVLFVDAGSVANKATHLDAQVGVGGGVRWKTPVGPLQIDLAYGVELQKWRLHLNVGFVF